MLVGMARRYKRIGVSVNLSTYEGDSTQWAPNAVVGDVVIKAELKDMENYGTDEQNPVLSSCAYSSFQVGCTYNVASSAAPTRMGTVWDTDGDASFAAPLSFELNLDSLSGATDEKSLSAEASGSCVWALTTNPTGADMGPRTIDSIVSAWQIGSGTVAAMQVKTDYTIKINPSCSVNLLTGAPSLGIGLLPQIVSDQTNYKAVAWLDNEMLSFQKAQCGSKAAVESVADCGTYHWVTDSVYPQGDWCHLTGGGGATTFSNCRLVGKVTVIDKTWTPGAVQAKASAVMSCIFTTGAPTLRRTDQ